MTPLISALAVALLDRLEAEERRLLCWGYTDGSFTAEEIESQARAVLDAHAAMPSVVDSGVVIEELLRAKWLFALPTGAGFRTRSAETVRLLATLRQIRVFASTKPATVANLWRSAPPLVADFRFQAPPRVFPRRDITVARAASELGCDGVSLGREILEAFVNGRDLSEFQLRATGRILRTPANAGTVVCAGTGSGKTMAFYLPAFMTLAPLLDATPWTKCIAIYPRNELLKDQLREAVTNAERIRPVLANRKRRCISFGALFQDVKRDAGEVGSPQYGWVPGTVGRDRGRVCPFMRCPRCGEAMLWMDKDRQRNRERLLCESTGCTMELGSDVIRLTRATLRESPPDVLFVSTEMLNQNMSAASFHPLFGIDQSEEHRPRLLLLDEIHTYEGSSGAQVAMLLRRWRFLSRSRPHIVGLSATLEDASRFFAELTGLRPGDVEEVSPMPQDLESEGADYQVALRGDSSWGTSLLSTTIQTLMLLRRVLEPRGRLPLLLAGSRVFAFSDRLDAINRLLADLRDAEGRWPRTNLLRTNRTVLAGLRSVGLPDRALRFAQGQSWDLVESIRPHLDCRPTHDSSLVVTRTSSQDRGVAANSDVVVATASLEVGFDDPTVGAIVQHKAPRSSAAFLQRKGRAGRLRRTREDQTTVSMRPWTVVVLSDFGRDRAAYQDYEHLFSPTLKPRHLPTRNRALLRMQATYALFDYLGVQAKRVGIDAHPWRTLARPAKGDDEAKEQAFYTDCLRDLLDRSDRQSDFGRFLQGALAISSDEVSALLWEPPRSVMLEAVPTLFRRLSKGWKRALENGLEPFENTGPPLPEFVQRTLFGKLLVPEVMVRLGQTAGPESLPQKMVLSDALREFTPGRVSRRFDITGEVSHWIPPDEGAEMLVDHFVSIADRTPVGRFAYSDRNGNHEVDVYRPSAIDAAVPDTTISSTSNGRPKWRSQVEASTGGLSVEVARGTALVNIVQSITFHTHHLGSPVELRRFVVGADFSISYTGGKRDPDRSVFFVDGNRRAAALGWESEVDALAVRIRAPEGLVGFVAQSDELLQELRPRRFRELNREDVAFDGVLNSFQRDTLVDVFLTAVLTVVGDAPTATVEGACSSVSTEAVAEAVAVLLDREADEEEEEGAGGALPRRVKELLEVLKNPLVLQRLRQHSEVLWSPVNVGWEPWLHRVLKSTLGASLREAIITVCPDIDEDDLTVEGEGIRAGDDDTIWVTEAAVGGTGALEAFYAAYGRDPRHFARSWHAALLSSDAERVAASFERTLELISGPSQAVRVVQAIAAIRSATGHSASHVAVMRLRAALASVGVPAEHATLTAIFARILRAGSSPGLDAYLLATLGEWRALEHRVGFTVDQRLFALVHSKRPGLETVVPWAPSTPAALQGWRRETLLGLLWRRPAGIRREALSLGNSYIDAPACDRLIVPLPVVTVPEVRIDSPSWFEELTEALNQTGIASLWAGVGEAAALAASVRLLASQPIDTGGLHVFVCLAGYRRHQDGVHLTVEMPEALQ